MKTGFKLRFTATGAVLGVVIRCGCFIYDAFLRHFPFRGQLALTVQLHDSVVLLKLALLFSTVLLSLEIRFAMLECSCSSISRCCCKSCAIDEWAKSFRLEVGGIPYRCWWKCIHYMVG